jgi:cation-transporting ATPase 13A3/4/5
MMHDPKNSTKFLIDSVLNLLTVTVPIALPAALSIGLYWAVARLKKSNIFCISPMKINLAAYINTFVFDKTGTLTEQSCSIIGFKPAA